MMKIKLNFEELPQATAFLLEKVEELTISINEMKQLLKRQTAAKEEMIGINEACEILSLAKPTVYALVQANKIPYYQPGKMLKFKRTELMEWMEKVGKNRLTKRAYTKRYKKE
ncbi:helix-turn-helix domain-containing protein [Phocaeicola coprocola]|jgi:excisionase family DNA binding protein|uniref:helix-turn-helix domain-containing protein n=1 Tax=Phocaeicola coprocola TaxID=310298 RepID=UPI0022E526AB|nr:helix-turn-helix domain-containing protein [Phocaeicola coprocola]